MTWGFGPVTDRPVIDALLEDGYMLFWFDGNRIASFSNFMQRERHNNIMEYAYYLQMMNIVSSCIVDQLKPTLLNPFRENGELRTTNEIAQEILIATSK